jgi:hypothetical protein
VVRILRVGGLAWDVRLVEVRVGRARSDGTNV